MMDLFENLAAVLNLHVPRAILNLGKYLDGSCESVIIYRDVNVFECVRQVLFSSSIQTANDSQYS